jgi:hypothetical protein
MSLQLLEEGRGPAKNRLLWLIDITGRVLVVAIVSALFTTLLNLSGKSSLTFQATLANLAEGILFALVLLPLARRLPYRMPARIISLFLPFYWTAYLGNLVEALFYTTTPRSELIAGMMIFIIPSLIIAWLMAWLFPAYRPEQPVAGIWQALRQRPLLSWIWRLLIVGLLYPIFLNYVFGALFSPILGPYYNNPAFAAQSHTTSQPFSILFPEETVRGIIFALTLLPALAVLRGRTWPKIFSTMLYLSMIGVVLEAVIGVAFSEPTWPVVLRIGETFNTGLDGIARGVIMALLLTLPDLPGVRQKVEDATTADQNQDVNAAAITSQKASG